MTLLDENRFGSKDTFPLLAPTFTALVLPRGVNTCTTSTRLLSTLLLCTCIFMLRVWLTLALHRYMFAYNAARQLDVPATRSIPDVTNEALVSADEFQ